MENKNENKNFWEGEEAIVGIDYGEKGMELRDLSLYTTKDLKRELARRKKEVSTRRNNRNK